MGKISLKTEVRSVGMTVWAFGGTADPVVVAALEAAHLKAQCAPDAAHVKVAAT